MGRYGGGTPGGVKPCIPSFGPTHCGLLGGRYEAGYCGRSGLGVEALE